MKITLPPYALAATFYLVLALSAFGARVDIPLDPTDHALKIMGPKEMKREAIEGGGLRLTCPPNKAKGGIEIVYTLPTPVQASTIGFEMKGTAGVDRPVAGCALQNGKNLRQVIEDLSAESTPRTIDLNFLASKAKMDLDSPVTSLRFVLRLKPDSGEQVVEIKNWWIE